MRVHARRLLLIALVALTHAGFFILYQRPDWDRHWSDQGGYHQLAINLARHGVFTRFPDVAPFIPEAIRTPGYPLFVAGIYWVFGPSHLTVALAQAAVFAMICLIVYRLALEVATPRMALTAAVAAAFFSPLPYYGALILTEVWTTLLATLGLWLAVKALSSRSVGCATGAGLALAGAGLTRPIFFFLPVFLMLGIATAVAVRTELRARVRPATAGALLGAYLLTLSPWLAYNYRHFHTLTISPAGGIGRSSWEGYWNGKFPGRVQAVLTRMAESAIPDRDLTEQIRSLPNSEDAMIRYVREWREIRRLYSSGPDPRERIMARVKADQIFWQYALENIRTEPFGYLIRRFTYGMFILWAGEIPVRYSDIDRLPTSFIRAIWGIQILLLVAAALGAAHLLKSRDLCLALLLILPPVYLSLVQWPFLTEARYSLPLKPLVILFTIMGVNWVAGWFRRRRPRQELQT